MKSTFPLLLALCLSQSLLSSSQAQASQDQIMTYIKLGDPDNVIYLIKKGNKATFHHLTYATQSLNNGNGISRRTKRFEVLSHIEDALKVPKEQRTTFHF